MVDCCGNDAWRLRAAPTWPPFSGFVGQVRELHQAKNLDVEFYVFLVLSLTAPTFCSNPSRCKPLHSWPTVIRYQPLLKWLAPRGIGTNVTARARAIISIHSILFIYKYICELLDMCEKISTWRAKNTFHVAIFGCGSQSWVIFFPPQ